jgi:hypothetical protein
VTPGIEALRREADGARVALVGEGRGLTESHVLSMSGIQSVTGYDFQGDQTYRRFVALANGAPSQPARWGFIRLDDRGPLDLRLLGLLNVSVIASSPEDTVATGQGLSTVGELTEGRRVAQSFTPRENGLRAIDVLAATHRRINDGELSLCILEENGRTVGCRRVRTRDLRDNDWLRLTIPEQPDSRNRRYTLEITALSGRPGSSPTAWCSPTDTVGRERFTIDGRLVPGTLLFRAFASAPDRWPGAAPIFSGDLNLYRNLHAQPRAWFARQVESLPLARHLDRLTAPGFDPATTVLVDGQVGEARPIENATVLESLMVSDEERQFRVDAPSGGLLVVSERRHPGWRAWADGRELTLVPADAVLLAVAVPPGAKTVRLRFRHPPLAPAFVASGLGMVFATAWLLIGWRRERRR